MASPPTKYFEISFAKARGVSRLKSLSVSIRIFFDSMAYCFVSESGCSCVAISKRARSISWRYCDRVKRTYRYIPIRLGFRDGVYVRSGI